MEPNQTAAIKAEYKVTNNDFGTIINETEIISALADNNHHLNEDKEYKAIVEFKVINNNPIVPNTLDNI